MLSLHLIICIIVTYLIYRDLHKLGSSMDTVLMWGIAAMVAPYVAGAAYLLLGRRLQLKKKRQREEQAMEEARQQADMFALKDISEKVACPMCGSQVPASFQNCPKCGFTMKLLCTSCGKELQRGWKICPYCGEKAPEK